jgi:hypothetical protein
METPSFVCLEFQTHQTKVSLGVCLSCLFLYYKLIHPLTKTEQYPKEYFLATLEKTKRGVLTETIEQPFVQVEKKNRSKENNNVKTKTIKQPFVQV